jgi:hypothetical protein
MFNALNTLLWGREEPVGTITVPVKSADSVRAPFAVWKRLTLTMLYAVQRVERSRENPYGA